MGGVETSKRPYYSTFLRSRNVILFARKMKVANRRSSLWMLKQIGSNLWVTFLKVFELGLKGNMFRSFQVLRGLSHGVLIGFALRYNVVWSDSNNAL